MVCCMSASPPYGLSLPPYYSTFVTSAERFETSALELALAKNSMGLLLASIQRSAWKGYPANFAGAAFSEVRFEKGSLRWLPTEPHPLDPLGASTLLWLARR